MGYKLKRILIYPDGVTEKQVYPAGWKPGSNTIAYYPLTSQTTVNDQSGNNRNLTNNGGVTFGTYKGVDCAYFSGSMYLSGTLISSKRPLTMMIWMYYLTSNAVIQVWDPFTFWIDSNTNYTLKCSPGGISGGRPTSDTGWKHLALTYDGGTTLKFYVNGTYIGSNTSVSTNGGTTMIIGRHLTYSAGYMKGGLSEAIYDGVIWTQPEIQNYYNTTKSNYGL